MYIYVLFQIECKVRRKTFWRP